MFRVVYKGSLADAEMLEDVAEHFVGDNLAAGYFGKHSEYVTQVFADEVAAEVDGKAFDNTLQTVVGTEESVVMASRGDDDVCVGKGREVGCFVNGFFQFVDVKIVLGRNPQECVVADLEKGGGKRDNRSLFVYLVVGDN